jgi:hypothetical protein
MQNGLFKLDWGSISDAVLMAVIASVLSALVTLVTTSGFSLYTADWVLVCHNMSNLAFIVAVVTLAKDFVSTNSGSILGVGPSN